MAPNFFKAMVKLFLVAKTFMCIGALPPQDHPHVFCDMGDDLEYVCPYCSTLYHYNPALAPNEARPAECELSHL